VPSIARLPSRRTRAAVLTVGAGVVAVLGVVALRSADTRPVPAPRQPEVEEVSPAQGSVVTPQSGLVLDLRDDLVPYRLVLTFANGERREVPIDEFEQVAALGRYTFRPGAGRSLPRLEPGVVRVTVTVASQADPVRPLSGFTWSFTVKA